MLLGWAVAITAIIVSAVIVLIVGKRCGAFPQTVAALVLQATLSLILLATWGLQDDALTYHEAAKRLVESIHDDRSAEFTLPPGKRTTVAIAGAFYWLAGPQPVLYLLFMATITAYMPTLLAAATTLFGFRRAAGVAAWLGVVAPPFVVWSPWLTREALAFVFLGCALVVFGSIYDGRWGVPTLVLFLFTFWGLWVTRQQLLLVLAFGCISALLLSRKITNLSAAPRKGRERIATVLFSGSLVVAAGFAVILNVVEGPMSQALTNDSYRTAVQNELSESSSLGIAYRHDDRHDYVGVPVVVSMLPRLELPLRLVLSMFGPPPWQWYSIPLLLAGLDGMLMLAVWCLILIQFVRVKSIRKLILITSVASLPLIAGEAYAHANYGISMRVRSHYLVVVLPAIAVSVTVISSLKRPCRASTACQGFDLGGIPFVGNRTE